MTNFVMINPIRMVNSGENNETDKVINSFKNLLNKKMSSVGIKKRTIDSFCISENNVILNTSLIKTVKQQNILTGDLFFKWLLVSQEDYFDWLAMFNEANPGNVSELFSLSINMIFKDNVGETKKDYYFIKVPVVRIALTDNEIIFVLDDFEDLLNSLKVPVPDMEEFDVPVTKSYNIH